MIGSIYDVKYYIEQGYYPVDENIGGVITNIDTNNLHNDNVIVTYKLDNGSTKKYLFNSTYDLRLYFTQQDNKIYWKEDGKPAKSTFINGYSSEDKVNMKLMSKSDIDSHDEDRKLQEQEEKERIAKWKEEHSKEDNNVAEDKPAKKSNKSSKEPIEEVVEEVTKKTSKRSTKKTKEVSYTPVATNKQMKWSKFVEASGLDEDTLVLKLTELKLVKKDGDFASKIYKNGYVKEDGETITKEGLIFFNESLS